MSIDFDCDLKPGDLFYVNSRYFAVVSDPFIDCVASNLTLKELQVMIVISVVKRERISEFSINFLNAQSSYGWMVVGVATKEWEKVVKL